MIVKDYQVDGADGSRRNIDSNGSIVRVAEFLVDVMPQQGAGCRVISEVKGASAR